MAYDNTPTTRMPMGLTNAAPWQTMAAAGIPDPTWAHVYHNDFDTYLASDWTVTLVGTGTAALTAGDGGRLLVTTTAASADAVYHQLTQATFAPLINEDTFFKFSGQISDTVTTRFHCGLSIVNAFPPTANNAVVVYKNSGTAVPSLYVNVAGVITITAFPSTAVITAGVDFEIGIHIDYLGNIEAFFNPGTGGGAAQSTTLQRGAQIRVPNAGLAQVPMSPSFGISTTATAAKTMQVDYVTAVRHR